MSVELGSKLNAVDIREGDDVYFECSIDAFPSADRISWKKDVSFLNKSLNFWFLISPVVVLSLSKEGQHSESQNFYAFLDKNDSKNSFMFTILNEKTSFFTFMFICSSYF